MAYLLANGLDKVRARKTLDGRPRRRWQTLFLSTGEVTLADKLREEGRTAKVGQDVRMVDIPVIPDGLDQAFETWEGFPSSKALADHLRVATRPCFGTPIRAFLDRRCRLPAVLGFIERHGSARFADWANPGERVGNCAGFWRQDGQGRLDFLFHTEGWKDACDGLPPKEVARACAEAGLLDAVAEAGKLRFQNNVKVPGRGTERFYFITGRGLEAYRQRQAEPVEG